MPKYEITCVRREVHVIRAENEEQARHLVTKGFSAPDRFNDPTVEGVKVIARKLRAPVVVPSEDVNEC